jgi:hypothetical protein
MKKLSIILFLGLFFFSLKGQNTNVVIEPSKMNVVYAGLENPLSLAISDILPENIYLTTNKGFIKGANGKYFLWLPFDIQGTVEVTIYSNPSGIMEKISTRTFRIKSVPAPVAYFGSKDGGEISMGEIALINFLSVNLRNFAFEGIRCSVKKYKFVIASKKKSQIFEGNSAALTPEIKSALNKIKKGDMIIITDVYYSFQGSPDYKIPGSITLTVKGKNK